MKKILLFIFLIFAFINCTKNTSYPKETLITADKTTDSLYYVYIKADTSDKKNIYYAENNDKPEELFLAGIWKGIPDPSRSEIYFWYFLENNYILGIFNSSFYEYGKWEIIDNRLYLTGEERDHGGVRTRSVSAPFSIIDYNNILIRDLVYTRMSDEDFPVITVTRESLDELYKRLFP